MRLGVPVADITREQLFAALDHAVSRVREWEGAGVDSKLAVFGLDVDDVGDLLDDRWRAYEQLVNPDEPHLLFVQGFIEGIVTGLQLANRERADV